jgi:hypothetical protein
MHGKCTMCRRFKRSILALEMKMKACRKRKPFIIGRANYKIKWIDGGNWMEFDCRVLQIFLPHK